MKQRDFMGRLQWNITTDDVMPNLFRTPRITKTRIYLALAVALVTDGLQLLTGPFGMAGFDQVLDVIAMILTSYLLGFHLLLLPTFVLELVPVMDWLPTWTGCVALLVSMRKREQATQATLAVAPPEISGPKNSNL
ncbi:MAG: hypothetical protein ABIQ35_03500 [Verrucomicrobiota bacterium]